MGAERSVGQRNFSPAPLVNAVLHRHRRTLRDVASVGDDLDLAQRETIRRGELAELRRRDANVARRRAFRIERHRRGAGIFDIRIQTRREERRNFEPRIVRRLDLEAHRKSEAVLAFVTHRMQSDRRDRVRLPQIDLNPLLIVFSFRFRRVIATSGALRSSHLFARADPLRMPVRIIQHAHRPRRRLAPVRRLALLIPRAHLPRDLLRRRERLACIRYQHRLIRSDATGIPPLRPGGLHDDLIRRLPLPSRI